MKSVQFVKNGYKTVMNEKLADIYVKKGKVKILGEGKKPVAKTSEVKKTGGSK